MIVADKLRSFFGKKLDRGLLLGRSSSTLRASLPAVEALPDWQLAELNTALDWNCFVLDSDGRQFGKAHSNRKRSEPETVPDRRIGMMAARFPLGDAHVLEFGCFEGIHTAGLCGVAKRVTGVDSRVENAIKTMVRLGFMDLQARVRVANVEDLSEAQFQDLKADFGHHVGVLYHLKDPVAHLESVGRLCPQGLMLDTHYASPEMAQLSYESGSKRYSYHHFLERGGYGGVFSGMYDHAKWLTLDGLETALNQAGYGKVEIVERREERNGPRCLLFASPR